MTEQWNVHGDDAIGGLSRLIRLVDPAVLGLTGLPGSGKTTLARALVGELGPGARAVSMDDFYLSRIDREAKGLAFRGGPGSHDLPRMTDVLRQVRDGRAPVTFPHYDTHADDRGTPETLTSVPHPLILEGWFLGYRGDGYDAIADLLDLLVFVDVDIALAKRRRFAREAELRVAGGGFSQQDMQRFWDDVLEPGIERLVPDARAAADVVIVIDEHQRVRRVEVDEDRPDVVLALGG